jgi:hypothetical protein
LIKIVKVETSQIKMFQKRYFVVCVVLIYATLIFLFFHLQREEKIDFDEACYFEQPCVRFCCKNEELCDQKYIDEHFNASLLPEDEFLEWNGTQGIKAYLEKPKCNLKLVESGRLWEFQSVKWRFQFKQPRLN